MLRLQGGGQSRVDERWSTVGEPPYRSRGHSLLQVLSGSCAIACDSQWTTLEPGWIYAVPGHHLLERRCAAMEHRYVNFTVETLTVDLRLAAVSGLAAFPVNAYRPWAEALAQVGLALTGDPVAVAAVEGLLLQVLAQWLATVGPATAVADPALRAALAFLDQHYRHMPTLGEVARAAGCSPSSLHARFTAAFHCSPTTYALERRLGDAQHLLMGTDLSIAEVAQRCGYHDPLHFSRIVKRHCGVSPTQLRRRR